MVSGLLSKRSNNMGNTRGGLSPAKISSLKYNTDDPDVTVNFHFNPHEFEIKKTNTWGERETTGNDIPPIHFTQGGPQTLSLTLYFDTQRKGTSVTSETNPLWKMMLVDPNSIDATTGKGDPPVVLFQWGPLFFKAIITTMSEKFILFSDRGVPLRSTVTIGLQQFIPSAGGADAELGFQTDMSKVPETKAVTSSDRIDLMAASMTGAAGGWKALAAQNNISDPLKPVVGSTMSYSK